MKRGTAGDVTNSQVTFQCSAGMTYITCNKLPVLFTCAYNNCKLLINYISLTITPEAKCPNCGLKMKILIYGQNLMLFTTYANFLMLMADM